MPSGTLPVMTTRLSPSALGTILGAVLMAATAMFDYRKLRDYWPFIYGGAMVLLVLVLIPAFGESRSGTQGWFALGPFQLQPSELAKLAMIIGFAGLASQFRGDLDTTRVLMLLGLCAVPMGLVMLQPDLGTALVSPCCWWPGCGPGCSGCWRWERCCSPRSCSPRAC